MGTIYGKNGADALRGTASADAIFGFWGDDSISGGNGRDFIHAGNGSDTIDGGFGLNVIDGEGGFDLVLYSDVISPIWADLRSGAVSFSRPDGAGDSLLNVEALDGGSGRDTFTGNGAGNLFRGNAGNDKLVGNIGSDTLVGGVGNDSLDGGNGQDSLVGGFGNDTMQGGLHEDIFFIGPIVRLQDPFTLALVDFGRDVIDGGAGIDTLAIDGPATFLEDIDSAGSGLGEDYGAPPVRANLGRGTLRIGDSANRSTLISIENIEAGSGDDSINGSASDNFIRTGDGANVVYAGAGDDTIVGGSRVYYGGGDVEILNGGDGDDAIYGMGSHLSVYFGKSVAPKEDILVGGAGNDTLYGADAIQTMSGGAGADVFVLTDGLVNQGAEDGPDLYFATTTITDFERGRDVIRFDVDAFRFDFPDSAIAFVGERAAGDLGVGELAYFRDGADTNLQLQFYDDTPSEYTTLTIVLTGYNGPLSASDFDLG